MVFVLSVLGVCFSITGALLTGVVALIKTIKKKD